MTSLFESLLKALKKKEKIVIQLDPDSLKENQLAKAQQNKIAELTAKDNKRTIEEAKKKETAEDRKKDVEEKLILDKQMKNLEVKKYPQYFSLSKFFNRLRNNPKLRKKLGFYSFDRSTKLSSFVDLGISAQTGDLIIIGEDNEVLLTGGGSDIFQSVGALHHDVASGKIPINVTPDGRYHENLEIWEPAEIIPLPGGKYKYSHAGKKPLYDIIATKNSQISELSGTIEEREVTIIDLQNEMDGLKVANTVNENSAEVSRRDLKSAQEKVSNIERSFRGIINELAQVRDTNTVFEENIIKLENQMEIMRNEAEREGVKLSDEKALETIQQIKRQLVQDIPEKEIHYVEKPTPESNLPQK